MYTIYVESNLASPLAGSATIEISPRDTVRKLVNDFMFALEKEEGVPGLAVCDKERNKLDWDATLESQGIREGSKLYIINDKESIFRPVHIAVIGITVIFIAIILFIAVTAVYSSTGGDIPFDFGIVIDAGSTHTEIYLYQWSGSKYEGTGEVNQRDYCTIDRGIAEGYDPSEIISCVNNVTKYIPSDNTSPVNLYLGATAGMRLLNASNPLEAQLILTAIKYALKSTPVREDLVDIIEGKDEGIFSWITTNFLSKALIDEMVNTTYGALDLGGASTQLAVEINSKTAINSTDVEVLKLYGKEYHVLSKSFLCFGLSQAADRSEAIIFMSNKNTTIIDPCLPINYSIKLQTRKFLERLCIQNENLTQWLNTNGNVKELIVEGSSDYKECKNIVKKLLNPAICNEMNFTQCFKIIDLAGLNKKFMAFSSFYYIVNYLSPNGTLFDFKNATENFCSLSYEQIKEKTPNKRLLQHLLQYCFGAVYMTELLTANYGFNNSTWENVIFQQNIKGSEVGWALGFMINATNAIPEELPRPGVISLAVFILLLLISVLMIFSAFILLRKNFKICQRQQKETLLNSGEV